MRFLIPALLTLVLAPSLRADDISGPNLATLRKTWWGSVFYECGAEREDRQAIIGREARAFLRDDGVETFLVACV